MYYYTAFGLRIASEFEFPELLEIDQPAQTDVEIRIGHTQDSLEAESLLRPNLWINSNRYLLHIINAAFFYAENGNLIVMNPYPNADAKSNRLYLLCNAMAAILLQRGLIPIHASGVLTDKGIVLLVGDCGAGKSTTLKALVNKGMKIFTDDVCVLRSNYNKLEGIPSYPVVKLWEKSFQLLQLGEANEGNQLWPNTNKYGIYFHDQFISHWEPVSMVFILEKSNSVSEPIIVQQTGIEAFVSIGSNMYGVNFIDKMKLNSLHFSVVNKMVKQCEIFKITRPATGESLNEIVTMIEKQLQLIA